MTDLTERYLETWNETDPATRRALLESHWTADATYTDPLVDVAGRDAVDATIGAVQAQFPGFVFTAAGPADAHHDQARFGCRFGPVDAEPPIAGFDVVVTDADGRIATVLGFLDTVPG